MEIQSVFMNIHCHFRSKYYLFKGVTNSMRSKMLASVFHKNFFQSENPTVIFESVFYDRGTQ